MGNRAASAKIDFPLRSRSNNSIDFFIFQLHCTEMFNFELKLHQDAFKFCFIQF